MDQKKEIEKLYKSPSTGQMCDAAQYIAEIMCCRGASKDNVNGLEYKFWNKSRKSQFVSEVVAARRLIDRFGERNVVSFIQSDGKNLYSLGKFNTPQFIIDNLARFCYKANKAAERQVVETPKDQDQSESTSSSVRSAPVKKQGLFSKIKKVEDIDG